MFRQNIFTFRSLRTKLLFSHICSILFTASLLGMFCYFYMISDLREVQQERMQLQAKVVSLRLDHFLGDKISLMNRLAEGGEMTSFSGNVQEQHLAGHFLKFRKDFLRLSLLERCMERIRDFGSVYHFWKSRGQ